MDYPKRDLSGPIHRRLYDCETCHVQYRAIIRGGDLGHWHELISYQFNALDHEEAWTLTCNLILPEYCTIIHDGKLVLKLPFIPKQLTPDKWLQKAKLWTLFS